MGSPSPPPYSPDLSLCDYDLNPKLKELMCETNFNDLEELKTGVIPEIRRLNQTGVLDGIDKLLIHWQKWIHLWGDYIEGF